MIRGFVLLTGGNIEDYLPDLYDWSLSETQTEQHTCRPINELPPYKNYKENVLKRLVNGLLIYILVDRANNNKRIGKIQFFDYNSRNKSAEVGYYLPLKHRKQGYANVLLELFIGIIFERKDLELNKIYGTVAACNQASIKLLEKFHFKLEGTYREHYWFSDGSICDQYHYSLLKREYIGLLEEKAIE
ncbi:GNAT family N-acetyltransferase [Paenibacillus polymyxa]|uniref:GNAT family N-acetyltransferase n=1 Tax=Paenibacillus polymyxa TaxID=1406 RepID=UPI0020258359|nr:GNAT family protein [Paenibacillus polymyxa]URJ61210.1 GNAT family protein [Paenibacillus polymyxa]